MLATLTEKRFSDGSWIFERKLDGIRLLAFRDGKPIGPGDLVREHAALLGKDARGRSPYD